jgi:hypothetical protein
MGAAGRENRGCQSDRRRTADGGYQPVTVGRFGWRLLSPNARTSIAPTPALRTASSTPARAGLAARS